ncbi:MAG: DegT/DnrJ/EryC1/StrS family aminotransferase, partial [Spirochaetota bacterium]
IIPVHLYGIICEMDPILEIARKKNLFVLEDAAQAVGGEYKGKKAGALGDAGAFSFCQSKHFTTAGEGGAVVTNDEEVAWVCRSFRDHGYDVKERLRLLELEQKLPYIHERVGFNYRMTEVQSVVGLHELERLESYHLKRRRENGEYLLDALEGHPGILYLPPHSMKRLNAFWLFPVVLEIESIRCSIKEFIEALKAEGVPVLAVQWPQAYLEQAYREHRGFGKHNFPFESKEYTDPKSVDYQNVVCPNAKWLEGRAFSFPVHPVYEIKHIKYMVEAFNKVYEAYKK